jgi:hypothetical protein
MNTRVHPARPVYIFLALLAVPGALNAQGLSPGLDSYLRGCFGPKDQSGQAIYFATNAYDTALVAYSEDRRCHRPGSNHTSDNTTLMDLATGFEPPVEKGRTIPMVFPDASICTNTLNAFIFADGKEVGDPESLRKLHERRAAQWREVHKTLEEDILRVPLEKWNPTESVVKLQARLLEASNEADRDRVYELQSLIAVLQSYQDRVKSDAEKYLPLKGVFLQSLQEWDKALSSSEYPLRSEWWSDAFPKATWYLACE